MITTSAVCVALFFGGWHLPVDDRAGHHSWRHRPANPGPSPTACSLCIVRALVFFAKTLVIIFVFMWVRWSLPRFRFDQIMNLAWRSLIPISLALLMLTSIVVYLMRHVARPVQDDRPGGGPIPMGQRLGGAGVARRQRLAVRGRDGGERGVPPPPETNRRLPDPEQPVPLHAAAGPAGLAAGDRGRAAAAGFRRGGPAGAGGGRTSIAGDRRGRRHARGGRIRSRHVPPARSERAPPEEPIRRRVMGTDSRRTLGLRNRQASECRRSRGRSSTGHGRDCPCARGGGAVDWPADAAARAARRRPVARRPPRAGAAGHPPRPCGPRRRSRPSRRPPRPGRCRRRRAGRRAGCGGAGPVFAAGAARSYADVVLGGDRAG